jgi:uncharacterized protein YdhG (YjbR/CyaY superfamily)
MASNQAAASVDAYIAGFPPETRPVLEELRALIRETAPEATEKISYAMPTFDVNGRYLVYFAGWKKHIALYPVSARMVEELGEEIEPYVSGKGTLQFPLSRPLPTDLIRRVVAFRRKERTDE